jgi:hypothetical protein
VAKAAECLLCKHETLSSVSSTAKKQPNQTKPKQQQKNYEIILQTPEKQRSPSTVAA